MKITKISSLLSLLVLFAFTSCVKDEVTSVALSKSNIAFNVGQSDSLDITVTWSGDLTEQPVSWTANNTSLVNIAESVVKNKTKSGNTFTKTIVLTALKAGTTTISFQSGKKTTNCEITVNQTNYTFNKAATSNWSDYYDIGTNSFDMYLLENTLSVDTAGNLIGNGTMLYLDFNVPITQDAIVEGTFTVAQSGDPNTFFPGQLDKSQGESIVIGTHLVTYNETTSSTTLITDGHYSITVKGDHFLIEGNLVSETNEVIHFSYEGLLPVTQKEVPVEIYPALTKGELVYSGDAYNQGVSNNFVVYLGSESVNFEDSILHGKILMLEFNTSLTVKDSIPSGTYTMITKLTAANDLAPYGLVFGYTTTDGSNWGSWYYGDTTNKLKTGNMVVSKSGNQYSIIYSLYDRFGSKISGTFVGMLTYIDATQLPKKAQALNSTNSSKNFKHKDFKAIKFKHTGMKSIRFK